MADAERDTNARVNGCDVLANLDRQRDCLLKGACEFSHVAAPLDIGADHDEFVSADSSNRVCPPHAVAQPRSDFS